MRYFTFFFLSIMSSTSDVCFILEAHLSSDQLYFERSCGLWQPFWMVHIRTQSSEPCAKSTQGVFEKAMNSGVSQRMWGTCHCH